MKTMYMTTKYNLIKLYDLCMFLLSRDRASKYVHRNNIYVFLILFMYTSPIIEGLVLLVNPVLSVISKKCMSSPNPFYVVDVLLLYREDKLQYSFT